MGPRRQLGGFWWGQLEFAAGPKIELLTPTGGPDAAFLERFLAARGAGPHHLTFVVPDIGATLDAVRAAGIEPVGVNLASQNWKEAFIHPKDAQGIVVQIAQQSGPPPPHPAPGDLPDPGRASVFAVAELVVTDQIRADELYRIILGGRSADPGPPDVRDTELTWPNGARLRLAQRSGANGLSRLLFTGTPACTAAERERAAGLAARLRSPLPGRLTGAWQHGEMDATIPLPVIGVVRTGFADRETTPIQAALNLRRGGPARRHAGPRHQALREPVRSTARRSALRLVRPGRHRRARHPRRPGPRTLRSAVRRRPEPAAAAARWLPARPGTGYRRSTCSRPR
ncbi:MAG: hypothetical protein ACR2FU_23520 [Streptosporangiaceae bacterium]